MKTAVICLIGVLCCLSALMIGSAEDTAIVQPVMQDRVVSPPSLHFAYGAASDMGQVPVVLTAWYPSGLTGALHHKKPKNWFERLCERVYKWANKKKR